MAERHSPSLARVRRRTIGRSCERASSTRPSKATLPLAMIATRSHSRSAWAMTWVEKMTVAPARVSRRNQLLEAALVDRVEPGEGFVEHDQARAVEDGAEQLNGLRHALGQCPDRLSGPVAEIMLLEQRVGAPPAFGERDSAKRPHERNGVARVHRRIEPALFGQVADLLRRIERMLSAEDPPGPARRVDDPDQHAQNGGLAGAVGSEKPVDRAGRDAEADPVDGARVAEILDELDRLDCKALISPFVLTAQTSIVWGTMRLRPLSKH